MSAPLIQFDDVQLTYGDQLVLGGLSFAIAPGEILCLVGPSGCGKTTALRVAAGLVAPTRGDARFAGASVTGPRRDVAVVFQDYAKALLPWRTAAGNVSLALEALGTPRAERAARIAALLDRVGLNGHAHKYPAQMSGGMQQRLQIARCLAQDPAALMMDEPFGALDAMTRQDLQDQTLDIVRSTGATILFVTHDLEEAIYLGDRVIGLEAASRPHRHRDHRRSAASQGSGGDARNPRISGVAPPALRFHSRRRGPRVVKGLLLPASADRRHGDRRASARSKRRHRAAEPGRLRLWRSARRRVVDRGDARHADRRLLRTWLSERPSGWRSALRSVFRARSTGCWSCRWKFCVLFPRWR